MVTNGKKLWAIEVKSGEMNKIKGLQLFNKRFPNAQSIIIGTGGMSLEEFFSTDPSEIFK